MEQIKCVSAKHNFFFTSDMHNIAAQDPLIQLSNIYRCVEHVWTRFYFYCSHECVIGVAGISIESRDRSDDSSRVLWERLFLLVLWQLWVVSCVATHDFTSTECINDSDLTMVFKEMIIWRSFMTTFNLFVLFVIYKNWLKPSRKMQHKV